MILTYFCLGSEAGDVEEQVIVHCCVVGIFQQQTKQKPKERWSEDAALFDAAADVE